MSSLPRAKTDSDGNAGPPEPRSPSVFWSREVRAQGTPPTTWSMLLVRVPPALPVLQEPVQIKCQHLPEEINSRTVGQPSYHHPAGCQGKLIMKESSSVSRTWDLQRQQEKGTLKNTVGPSRGFSGMWGWGGGVWGGGMWKEHQTMGGLYPPCQRAGRSLDGRKLEIWCLI